MMRVSPKRGFTLIELLVVLAIIGVLLAFLFPAVRTSREAPRRTQCRGFFKQMGLALHNYHDAYGAFPPAYTVDANGDRLHSWRTLILPYLNQKALYDQIDLSKPWNDPANAAALKESILQYGCPSAKVPNASTTYLAVVTPESILRPVASCSISDVKDGTSNTLLLIEVDAAHAVPWMAPTDADEALLLSFDSKFKLSHSGGLHGLFGDGAVKFLTTSIPNEVRQALITVAGNETIGDF